MTGKVVASPGEGQSFELQATAIKVVGWVDDPDTYPMAAKRHSIEYLREVAHLRPRTNLIGAVARVRHTWRRRSTASSMKTAISGCPPR